MNSIFLSKNLRIVLLDITLLSITYFLPTFSHIIGFPIYLLDPMRIVVLSSLLLLGNKKNAYILAFSIPLFSFIISGHPVFPKNLLISIELITNLLIFFAINRRIGNTFISVFSSIVFSKLIYYGLKYIIVSIGFLEMDIISTSLIIQLFVALSISLIFAVFYSKQSKL